MRSATHRFNDQQGDLFDLPSADVSQSNDAMSSQEEMLQALNRGFEGNFEVARVAGRMNASAVSEVERSRLLAERATLLDKKFEGELSRSEEARLDYVRWSLDRIEDALHGPAMDRLEAQIAQFKRLANHLAGVRADLGALSSGQSKRRKR